MHKIIAWKLSSASTRPRVKELFQLEMAVKLRAMAFQSFCATVNASLQFYTYLPFHEGA